MKKSLILIMGLWCLIGISMLQAQSLNPNFIHRQQGEVMLGLSTTLTPLSRLSGLFVSTPFDTRLFGGKFLSRQVYVGGVFQYSRLAFVPTSAFAAGALGRYYMLNARLSPFAELGMEYFYASAFPPNDPNFRGIIGSGGYATTRLGLAYRFGLVGLELSVGHKRPFRDLTSGLLRPTLDLGIHFHM